MRGLQTYYLVVSLSMREFFINRVLDILNTLSFLLSTSAYEVALVEIPNCLRLLRTTYFIIFGVYIIAFLIMSRLIV